MVDPAVEVENVVKHYGKVVALAGISLTVGRGEMFALLGPNGAGKTTLFSILTTLRRPTEGRARVLGHDVVRERDSVRAKMGIVFQEPALAGRLGVRDNLRLMGLFYGLGRAASRRRSDELLETLGLGEAADRPANKLSGGQKRRLELARALVSSPEILFLDEATLGLDVDARRAFWQEIRRQVQAGRTVFFTTHYMEEAEVADRIALVNTGRVLALDTPQALKAQIGGGMILIATEDDERAREWLSGKGFEARAYERGLLIVDSAPAERLPEILTGLPVKTCRAEIREPSLEDVFLALAGRELGDRAAANADEQRPAEGAP
ncbi:MAG: ATP-binding cassette domain-containing protein [Gammaproteobacteria bacterium]